MAKGKKTGGRDFAKGHPPMGGRPPIPEDLKKSRALNRIDYERILNKYICLTGDQINQAIKSKSLPIIDMIVCKILAMAFNEGDPKRMEFVLSRLIGSAPVNPVPLTPDQEAHITKKTFTQFCIDAGYPPPYLKQIEMMDFGMLQTVARLLLGSRGYGKTDYVVILGIAYMIYLDPNNETNLIITKSRERNSAILAEIAHALKANGVELELENSNFLRIAGLKGKDHSVSAVTIKTVSLRGRHPKRVILDDPVTEDDTSDATRALVEKKYNEVLKLCSNVLIIGQPAHKYDLYAKLRDLVKTLEVPHGTIPELDHDLTAQRLAGVDEASISASYFLKVLSEGVSPFDQVKFKDKYEAASSVAFVDPSFEGGDYTAVTILSQYMGGVQVVGFTYKKAWNHCLDDLVQKLVKYRVQRLCFETNSLGDQPIIMLRAALGNGIGVIGKKTNGNKHSRIMMAGSYAHLIHISKESDKVYIDQVLKYEYKAKNDDAPDSLASCLEWVGLIRGKM